MIRRGENLRWRGELTVDLLPRERVRAEMRVIRGISWHTIQHNTRTHHATQTSPPPQRSATSLRNQSETATTHSDEAVNDASVSLPSCSASMMFRKKGELRVGGLRAEMREGKDESNPRACTRGPTLDNGTRILGPTLEQHRTLPTLSKEKQIIIAL